MEPCDSRRERREKQEVTDGISIGQWNTKDEEIFTPTLLYAVWPQAIDIYHILGTNRDKCSRVLFVHVDKGFIVRSSSMITGNR